METQEMVSKKQKAGKIASYVINVLSIIIMLFAVFVVISSLTSKDRGYTAYFGKSYVIVKSDSMAKDVTKADNFKAGDVIAFRILSTKEKQNLKVGDIITFWDNNISSTRELNTHRIYEIRVGDDGQNEYSTMGDNNLTYDKDSQNNQIWRKASDIQGIYAGKSVVVGQILTYLQSKTGFAIFIVVPCVLIMIYCAVLVVMNLMRYAKGKAVIQHEDNVDALKAELREQLLKEMAEKEKGEGEDNQNIEPETENAEIKEDNVEPETEKVENKQDSEEA